MLRLRRVEGIHHHDAEHYAALLKAIIDATAFAAKAENRKQIAAAIAPANYLNQPETVRGTDPHRHLRRRSRLRADRRQSASISIPSPGESFAVWIMTAK